MNPLTKHTYSPLFSCGVEGMHAGSPLAPPLTIFIIIKVL